MIWSKIKKAINSTLGTSGFKPLDKIITDSFSEVVEKQNQIKNNLENGENDYEVERARFSDFATNVLLPNDELNSEVVDLGTNMKYGVYVVTLEFYDVNNNVETIRGQGVSVINLSKKMINIYGNIDDGYINGSVFLTTPIDRLFLSASYVRFRKWRLEAVYTGTTGSISTNSKARIRSITILPTED